MDWQRVLARPLRLLRVAFVLSVTAAQSGDALSLLQRFGGSSSAHDQVVFQAVLSDDEIFKLAATGAEDLSSSPLNSGVSRLASTALTAPPRHVYVDLGANWANTLRLFEDLAPKAETAGAWEIYAFEASPFIQPYVEHFAAFLNGGELRPPLSVPPSGSSAHLARFAKRYGCPDSESDQMRECMFNRFRTALHKLTPDAALKDPALIDARLALAAQPLGADAKNDGRSRFVAVPAAAGAANGTLSLGMMTPEQMIRGGAYSRVVPGYPVHTVPVVDVVSWLTSNFRERDYVMVKMDIEGAEFKILDALLTQGHGCLIDTLAMECHSTAGNCPALMKRLKDQKCIHVMTEGHGYQGWDHHSSPDKYYPADPRRPAMAQTQPAKQRKTKPWSWWS